MAVIDWKRRLRKLKYSECPRPKRRVPSGLVGAIHDFGSTRIQGRIKQISTTGFYLLTANRWPIGELLDLMLEREDLQQKAVPLQINVQARVSSYGEDGIGLAFVLPSGMDSSLWEFLIENADAEVQTEQIGLLFRMVRTILFLCRLCPSGAEEATGLLGKRLDGPRTSNALDIALEAEERIKASSGPGGTRCHPQMLIEILREASWASDEVMRQLWAGLLVTSCTPEGTDESNRNFVELMVQLTPAQGRILAAGCTRAMELADGAEDASSKQIVITPEQMIQISGMHDLYRSGTDVSYLYNFGLLDRVFDFTTYLPKDSFNITPSKLGLELFRRCQGNLLPWNEVELRDTLILGNSGFQTCSGAASPLG